MLQVRAVYTCDKSICIHSEDCLSSDESFRLHVKIQQSQVECKKIATPSHLITNLAYKLKPHQTRDQYLRSGLDTCTDVNIMPASVYKLVFNDPKSRKLALSTLEIGTYTTDTEKIVGSFLFYLAHLDTKNLQKVTFYVAQNDGSVLLSCNTTLVLGLIQPCTRLDYLPPRPSLIVSLIDHPMKTRRVSALSSRKEVSAQSQNKELQFPSWWLERSKFYKAAQMFLMLLDAFQVLSII